MMERHLHPTPDERQYQEVYTLEDAADVLLLGVKAMRHAVFTGELPAQIVGPHIIAISRAQILAWYLASEESHHDEEFFADA
ncbi:MAG: hypothetical protein KC442_17290, partial [Thermomicrobiales bacterium]|nr:hypothetical protein [Thermomicrobiales bacterium]